MQNMHLNPHKVTRNGIRALKAVKRMLESDNLPEDQRFDMNISAREVCEIGWCGTVACIGGSMALYAGMNREDAQEFVLDAGIGPYKALFFKFNIDEKNDMPKAAQKIGRFIKRQRAYD